jgi:serine/threonine-protein kinase
MTLQPERPKPLGKGHMLDNKRYWIHSVLTRGGQSVIYLAEDTHFGSRVAIKEFLPPTGAGLVEVQSFKAQFDQEILALQSLSHPSIVRTIDTARQGDQLYMIMPLVEGENLQAKVEREGPLAAQDVVDWIVKLLEALEYCHDKRVLHRGIKPRNLIVKGDHVILVGFGLTKMLPPNPQDTSSTLPVIKGRGARGYAPPEQFASDAHTDVRSDLYSVGATMYFCLTGQTPPDTSQRPADSQADALLSLDEINPQVAGVVRRAMELDPANRFQSAGQMREALEAASHTLRAKPVFISHCQEDDAYADKLASDLEARGFEVWLDEHLGAGVRWTREIEDKLEGCGALIVIMTPRSRRSDWVDIELAWARDNGKAILPILLKGRPFFSLWTTQYEDLRGDKLPSEAFYKRLRQALGSSE